MGLSLERFNTIEDLDPIQKKAIEEAEVPLQALHKAANDHEYLFVVDLGARGIATIGGMFSTFVGYIPVNCCFV